MFERSIVVAGMLYDDSAINIRANGYVKVQAGLAG
jgi:hypothetical protein